MANTKPKFAAFNQGVIPTIACFIDPTTKTALGVTLDALIAAMQAYVSNFVAPVWGTPAKLVKSTGFVKGAWAIVFLTTRYASLASLSAGAVFVAAAVVLGEPWPVIAFAALAFGFVALRHRANIARLRAGTEPRARLRRATPESGS